MIVALRVLAAAGVIALAAILGWRLAHRDTKTASAILHGKVVPAPGFRLPRLEGGGKLSLASFRGRAVVLNFWASDCIPCKKEMPQLEAAARRWAGKGVSVVGVDEEPDAFAGRAFVRTHGVTYPVAIDKLFDLASAYGLIGTPTTFFIDRRGRIVKRVLGPVAEGDLDTQIAHALAS